MAKPPVVEHRYDFRGGRNVAISPDLLNANELVDCTNARLSSVYGGFAKRTGTQRIHKTALGAAINGVTQWDGPSGKQVVAISGGSLFYRNGFDFTQGFQQVTPAGTTKTTANQGVTAGWIDPDGVDDGVNSLSRNSNGTSSISAPLNAIGSALYNKLGDPAIDGAIPSGDNTYTLTGFKVTCDASGVTGTDGGFTATVVLHYATDGAGNAWTVLPGSYSAQANVGQTVTINFSNVVVSVPGAPIHVWIRAALSLTVHYLGSSGTVNANVKIFSTVYKTDNFPVTWLSTPLFSTNQPAFFAPFRSAAGNFALVLFIASGGHYWSWDGVNTLTQLDPAKSAPGATVCIPYHTRMFAMTASTLTPGQTPKTIYWSIIGDATDFRTGNKSQGGFAVTDFLTGQQLTALEVIGSSLLMSTTDCVMRFTGHASDDIIIAQDTEGVSAEVGSVSAQTLKRFENVAAMLTDRGPYVVTETYSQPSGEQLNPDWQALDTANLKNASLEYNRFRKELLFAVPRAGDGGVPKSVFSQSVRLQAWQGPWIYPFAINCQCKYYDANNSPNTLSGGIDGFVRLMDVGRLDDVNFDGTGGTNITMTVEIPVIHFGSPGLKKALKWMLMQANLPIGSNLQVNVAFDGGAFTPFAVVPNDTGEEDYRVDTAGDTTQGFRARIQFVDSTAFPVTVNGFSLYGWNMLRTT